MPVEINATINELGSGMTALIAPSIIPLVTFVLAVGFIGVVIYMLVGHKR